MKPAQKKAFEKRLHEKRDELLAEGPAKLEPTRVDPLRVGADEDEQPLAEMAQSIASTRNRERARTLEAIARALTRLKTAPDEFGLCTQCEEEIDPRRLSVSPWVELCVECQAKKDPTRGGARRHAGDFVE